MATNNGMAPKHRAKLQIIGAMLDEAAQHFEYEALECEVEGDTVSAANVIGQADAYRRVSAQLRDDFPEIFRS